MDIDALVSTIQIAMGSHAALPAAKLGPARRHLAALRPRLEALGLEVSSSHVRRPLLAQLLGALEGGFVPAKGLDKRVAGANAKEVKAAIETLIEDGRAREVVRTAGPGFLLALPGSGALIEQGDLAELLRRLANAQRLVKRAIAKRGPRSRTAVLRDDVMGPLVDFDRSTSVASPAPATADGDRRDDHASLAQTIRAQVEGSDRPLRIPELLRSLRIDKEAGKRALLDGASAGLFGLEPESGMARLAPSDAEWCPAGPQGTRLSWVVARQKGGLAR